MGLSIVLIVVILYIFAQAVIIIQPYEIGLAIRLGSYVGQVKPGFRLIVPFITDVIKLDLRTQVIDVPSQEVITKDNSPTDVNAIIYLRVMDPERAYFEVSNYRQATVALAQTSLRGIIGDMELDEILYNRDLINRRLRDILDKETDQWGVKIERVEIKEVNPTDSVKQAMTEQTAAERERRAAILKADGEKRAAILKAEGLRQSMILESEGERQSQILRAEGERQSKILKAQGDAQSLRIVALGSQPLDKRAITVLSLNTLEKMANGQATKIIYPFEVSSLIKQSAKFLGAEDIFDKDDKPRKIDLDEKILGSLPDPDEIASAVESVKKSGDIKSNSSSIPEDIDQSSI